MTKKPKSARPRSIADDIVDMVETATSKWTRQKKSEERHPGMIRYRASRMTREPRTTQKEAAWEVLEAAYMAASGNGRLPALARQIYYQARPKIMAMTEDRELAYGYFSQTLLPDYIEEHGVDWNVVYDARGHFEERHTNRRIGCGTIEVGNYLHAINEPPEHVVSATSSPCNTTCGYAEDAASGQSLSLINVYAVLAQRLRPFGEDETSQRGTKRLLRPPEMDHGTGINRAS
jgi:hypothetical protein